jgi:hypothetical protein
MIGNVPYQNLLGTDVHAIRDLLLNMAKSAAETEVKLCAADRILERNFELVAQPPAFRKSSKL